MSTTLYYEQVIVPASGGFGEYDTLPINGDGYANADDLEFDMHVGIDALGGDFVALSDDPLPDWAEDIRGRIHNEPERVYAALLDGQVVYFGLTGIEKD